MVDKQSLPARAGWKTGLGRVIVTKWERLSHCKNQQRPNDSTKITIGVMAATRFIRRINVAGGWDMYAGGC